MHRDLTQPIALEIIVTNAAEAVIAQRAGATRVELIASRDRGGLTPDPQTIEAVIAAAAFPVHVMLRPHDRDFVYAPEERDAIVDAARRATALGAASLVVGGLTRDGSVDTDLIARVRAESPLPITFHRAFDAARDLVEAYETLTFCDGVVRILSSGGASSAWEGRAILQRLAARGRPSIMPGAGIDAANVAQLVRSTGVREVHVGNGARIEGTLTLDAVERIVYALKNLIEWTSSATGPASSPPNLQPDERSH